MLSYILFRGLGQRGFEMSAILQAALPVAPWMEDHTLRLPGTVPIALESWLQRDEVFSHQMALRDRLIAEQPEVVHAMAEGAEPAARELLAMVLGQVATDAGYRIGEGVVTRPDGVAVSLDGQPLVAAGRLVQEDLVILEKPEGAAEHVMTGAIVCFPSNWTLSEKFGRTLGRIHQPVESYDAEIARRVQRLFDGIREGRPIMRSNLLLYGKTDLHNPRHEHDRHHPAPGDRRYIRVERQTFIRLPVSRAVVFGIHTYMVEPDALTPEQREKLSALRPEFFGSPA